MSNFICKKCGTMIQDTPNGYVTECEHYPIYRVLERIKESDDRENLEFLIYGTLI